MATSFAALMALSASQTRKSEVAVKSALAERQRKEAQRRKEQEERERREREMEAKLRLKRLEDEKREQERQRRLEEERAAKERELRRRQQQERDALRYGPTKARTDKNGYPMSSSANRRSSSSDDESAGANALTREEKRRRRLEAEMRGRSPPKRSMHSGYSKAGKRLPGGAVDITTTETSFLAESGGSQSIRERLASQPAKLIKLNVNKRDTRTIDEIVQDRAKARSKVLDGDEARGFNDWFGRSKKESPKKVTPVTSASNSRDNTPGAKCSSGSASPAALSAGLPKVPPGKSSTPSTASASKAGPSPISRAPSAATSRSFAIPSKPVQRNAPSAGTMRPPPVPIRPSSSSLSAKSSASTGKPFVKKRPRSPSLSPSPPPPSKKRASERSKELGATIWKIFGKDRTAYTARDVLSDDEDMEAGATDLEKEERKSMFYAKREDHAALAEERRHEEEKRRRKKERDLREKRA